MYFYNNRHFQEVRATLRYGVEAHKGLILFTGEAGRGKTMLLHRVIRELETTVTFVVESDPEVSFGALLQLLARNLQGEIDAADRLSQIQSCKTALRSEIDRGGTVCLVIDNAERLRDDTLECVFQNFLGAGISADRGRQLLQVILAGRPELRERLLQPRWRSLAPVPGVVCHVESLEPRESVEYIKQRLHAERLPPSALQSEAADRIAAYAGGDLRLTNSLCSSVLALAARSPAPKVSADLVVAAARELGLLSPRPVQQPPPNDDFEISRERAEPFKFHLDERDPAEVVGQTFLHGDDNQPRFGRGQRDRTAVWMFLGVILLAAAFLWLCDQFGSMSLAQWSETFKALSGLSQPAVPPPTVDSQDPVPAPTREEKTPPVSDQTLAAPVLPETDNTPPLPSIASPAKPAERPLADQPRSPSKNPSLPSRSEGRASENPEISDKQLEMEIYKAIANRAIMGVAVSVSNGTAYLEGRVATERQRLAAERAARSVEGIERVRNRISVS